MMKGNRKTNECGKSEEILEERNISTRRTVCEGKRRNKKTKMELIEIRKTRVRNGGILMTDQEEGPGNKAVRRPINKADISLVGKEKRLFVI